MAEGKREAISEQWRVPPVRVKMCSYGVQVFFPLLLASAGGHFLFDRYPNERYDFDEGPLPPHHPLVVEPQPHFHPVLQFPPNIPVQQPPPLIYRDPGQTFIIPIQLRGIFPPFVERIVQRIQTFWSVYNPPELLTRPPDATTTEMPDKKVNTTTQTPQEGGSTTEAGTTVEMSEKTDTTTPTSMQDFTTKEISTLAVFEVTPTVDPGTTTAGTDPPDLEAETKEPILITPETANLEGRKEAFLRYFKTGKLPPLPQVDNFE